MLLRTVFALQFVLMGCWGQWGAYARRLSSRVVKTKHGDLRGFIVTPPDKHLQPVEVFLGVPFASAPTERLRFMPPVSPSPWMGIRMADSFGPVCPQRLPDISNETAALSRMPRGRLHYLKRLLSYLHNQSEDCLYLNVYAPAKVGRDFGHLPVIVYIHGESYEWNSGNPYDGTVLASYGDVVVVTINFRLGILGFLRTGDDSARGNYGLLDQVGALIWIAENIEKFGGDVKNVTLIGQGYGAACINFLMISGVARGYFHRAILQSGSALSPWALVKDPIKYTHQVAVALNCPVNNDKDLVACLRQRSLEDLNSVNIQAPEYLTSFGPTVDGLIIPNEPQQLMHNYGDRFASYDLILGTTKIEAVIPFTAEDMHTGLEPERRDKILRTFLTNNYEYHLNEIFALLVNEYTDWTRPMQHPINTRDATMEIIGDAVIVAPLVIAANLHSLQRKNTYFYNFAYQSRDGDYPRRLGCFHGEELPYVFGAPFVEALGHFHRNYTKAERTLSEAVMTYWSNFARTGDPNGHGKQIQDSSKNRSRFTKVAWPVYNSTHEKYLAIGMRPKVRHHYRAHKLSIWLRLIPVIHQEDKGNTAPRHHVMHRYSNMTVYLSNPRKPGAISHMPSFSNHEIGQSNYSSISIAHPTTLDGIVVPYVTSQETLDNGAIQPTTEGSKNASDRLRAEAIYHGSYSTALSVTVAVGCSLLILNVLIFAGVYYQRDKNRMEAKLQKKNYKLKKVNEELSCHTTAIPLNVTQKQPIGVVTLPRAPPPSPVGQSSRQREQPDFPSAAIVAQTLNTLKTPPKVPPKPLATFVSSEINALTEAQPLLAQNSSGSKSQNKNQKMQEIRV